MTEGLVANGISKAYSGTTVLKDVNLAILPGQVVALIGHNGAGKSTLLRSLSGAEVPDRGHLSVDGRTGRISSPADATSEGIACVYQELSLVDELTVAENLFLGTELRNGPVLNRREMNAQANKLCEEFGVRAQATDLVAKLPVAQRQLLEVARAVHRNARYLLLDEPTTALEQEQIDGLLDLLRMLAKERHVGILLVNHKLDEVFAIADHIVGLANGRIVLDGPVDAVDRAAVIEAIVGEQSHATDEIIERADISTADLETTDDAQRIREFGAAVFSAVDVAGNGLHGVNVEVRAGEILGIYGLVGSGRSRFLRTVYGAEPLADGSMSLSGADYRPSSPAAAIAKGVGFLSEERKSDGFIPQMSSVRNVALPVLDRFRRSGILNWRGLRQAATQVLSRVTIRGDVEGPITSLSGGNQQKALFARVALQGPKLLLLDEPTKGVDIGAKLEIHQMVRRFAEEEGMAIIVVSSEEEELTGLADTIAVFREGSCDGTTYPRDRVTPAQLRELAWTADRR